MKMLYAKNNLAPFYTSVENKQKLHNISTCHVTAMTITFPSAVN